MTVCDAFLSGDTLKRLPGGETKIFRVVALYCRPFDPDTDKVLEFKVETGHTTEEGGVVRLNDKELAEKLAEAIEENGYEVIEQKHKKLETLNQKELTILSGSFQVKALEKEEEKQ